MEPSLCRQGRYDISFRVRHPTADLSVLAHCLELELGRLCKVGEPRCTPTGQPLDGRWERSWCYFKAEPNAGASLSETMRRTVATIDKHKGLLRDLAATGGTFSFFVGWFIECDTGETFEWQLLRDMAELKISFDLCVYGNEIHSEDVEAISSAGTTK
jgi:hypothetical protein